MWKQATQICHVDGELRQQNAIWFGAPVPFLHSDDPFVIVVQDGVAPIVAPDGKILGHEQTWKRFDISVRDASERKQTDMSAVRIDPIPPQSTPPPPHSRAGRKLREAARPHTHQNTLGTQWTQ